MTLVRNIIWFRRDLRIGDHPALLEAIKNSDEIVPLFILDKSQIAEAGAKGPPSEPLAANGAAGCTRIGSGVNAKSTIFVTLGRITVLTGPPTEKSAAIAVN